MAVASSTWVMPPYWRTVAMMRALKQQDWGAGRLMKQHEAALRAGTVLEARAADIDDPSQPVLTVHRAVPLDWTDYNDHMTEAKYLQAFGDDELDRVV